MLMSPDRLPSKYERLVHTGAITLDGEVGFRRKPSLPSYGKGRNRWGDVGITIVGLTAVGLAIAAIDQIGRISDALSDNSSKSSVTSAESENFRTYRLVQKP